MTGSVGRWRDLPCSSAPWLTCWAVTSTLVPRSAPCSGCVWLPHQGRCHGGIMKRAGSDRFEHSWVVLGVRRGRLWVGRAVKERTDGHTALVEFDPEWVLKRHHSHGDVIGWLHTHPGFLAMPSERDVRT